VSSRQTEIIRGAARVFKAKGYHAATIQDIADEVGLLKGSLYHYVASKEELLYLVVKDPIRRVYRRLEKIADGKGSAREKITRAIAVHLEAFDAHYPHLFVYVREMDSLWVRLKDRIAESPKHYERLWHRILQDGIKAGELRDDLDVKVVTYAILGAMNWMYKWYEQHGRLSMREVANIFARTFLDGLLVKPAVSNAKKGV
jgi:AcrR family transcriptional regulator